MPELVVSAGSVNTLKSRLDKFLSDQEVLYDYNVARVFTIWGDLEIAHGHFQDPETAQPSGDGWAVTGFWAISRWAKGVFRILNIGAHRYTFT